ncbi:MAG: FAD-dependent oxidoreductase [bacterium]
MIDLLPPDSVFNLCAVGREQLSMTTYSILAGGMAGVGMEDNIYHSRGEPAKSNAQLVERTVRIARGLQRAIASPDEARRILGIRKKQGSVRSLSKGRPEMLERISAIRNTLFPPKPTKLFEPIRVGKIQLKNRIKMPAMAIAMGEEGSMSEAAKAFYLERAKGGVALMGVSCTATRLIQDPMLGLYHDRFIPGLKDLAETVRPYGAKLYAQMGVGYSWAFGDAPVQLVSPSGITCWGRPGTPFRMGGPFEPTLPKELTVEEIHQIVEAYGDGARRAQEAGFDAVEIIAAVGYVIAQFISPATNLRKDPYGGSLENRMRLFLEIIENIRRKTGGDFPVLCRISGADLLDGKGYSLEDTKKIAPMLEKAGIAQIDVMAGWHNASVAMIQTQVPQGSWVHLAEGVKSVVRIPVAAGTQIQDIRVAERVVAEGRVDMVYMARALVADPALPIKAQTGRLKDIRPCMNCCRCMAASDEPPVHCTVNARMGREWEYPEERPAKDNKRVLVVGGGPAGMEAARIATLRGHRVTLCEQRPRLGGAMLLSSITNPRIGPVLRYMAREVKKLSIDVRFHTRVTPELVREMKPDVLVVAQGGKSAPLAIPGIDKEIVLTRSDAESILGGRASSKGGFLNRLVSAAAALLVRFFYDPRLLRWLLAGPFPFKKRVTILGGGFAGVELGETLLHRGKQVAIAERSRRMGYDIDIIHRWVFLKNLKDGGAQLFTEAEPVEVKDQGVVIRQKEAQNLIASDTVVPINITTNKELAEGFEGKVPEVFVVGDCAEPAKLMEATTAGFLAGQKI